MPANVQPKKKGFVCSVCGYFEEYDGDELPEDYQCPVCKHGRDVMEPAEQ